MANNRVIKPEFFRNEDLYNAEIKYGLPLRIAYAGLWTCCDREGRFRWRPRQLRLDVLPYDEVDFEEVLNALVAEGYIVKYSGKDANDVFCECGVVPKFRIHQHINNREAASELPDPPEGVEMREPGPRPGRKPGSASLASHLNETDARRQPLSAELAAADGLKDKRMRWVKVVGIPFRVEEDQTVLCVAEGDDSPSVVWIPTSQKGGVEIGISAMKAKQYQEAFSGIDVLSELKNARQWSIDNVSRRKTATGMGRFLSSWMATAQNSGRNSNRVAVGMQSDGGFSKADAVRDILNGRGQQSSEQGVTINA